MRTKKGQETERKKKKEEMTKENQKPNVNPWNFLKIPLIVRSKNPIKIYYKP